VRVVLIADPMLRALIWLVTETGLRVGEALRLKWTDVDLVDDAVMVRVSKTPSGRRTIPLSEDGKTELLKWKKVIGSTSDYVFPKLSNIGTHTPTVRRAWTTALKLAAIPFFPITNRDAIRRLEAFRRERTLTLAKNSAEIRTDFINDRGLGPLRA